MKLLGPRLLVEPIEAAQSSGGIVFPESLRGHNLGGPKLFRVLQVGPGRQTKKGVLVPLDTQAGDRVLCHSYFQGPVEVGGGRLVVSESEILAIFPQTNNQKDNLP